jgi:hypothetical protein
MGTATIQHKPSVPKNTCMSHSRSANNTLSHAYRMPEAFHVAGKGYTKKTLSTVENVRRDQQQCRSSAP